MTDQERYWLAGILEGEGSFLAGPPSKPYSPIVVMTTTDQDIAEKVSKLFGTHYYTVKCKRYIQNNWKIPYVSKLSGRKAVVLMKELYSLMGLRRQFQINLAIASYENPRNFITKEEIDKIKEKRGQGLSHQKIADIFMRDRTTITKILNNYGRYSVVCSAIQCSTN